jgi:hypothetical protein
MSVEIFLPPKAHVEGAPNLANGGFAVELDACALAPDSGQTEKGISLGSECDKAESSDIETRSAFRYRTRCFRDEALAAKGKNKNQEQIENNME